MNNECQTTEIEILSNPIEIIIIRELLWNERRELVKIIRVYELNQTLKEELVKRNVLDLTLTNQKISLKDNKKLQKILIDKKLYPSEILFIKSTLICSLESKGSNNQYYLSVYGQIEGDTRRYSLTGSFDSNNYSVSFNRYKGTSDEGYEYSIVYGENNTINEIQGSNFIFTKGREPEYDDSIDEDIKFCFINDTHRVSFNKVLDLVIKRLGRNITDIYELVDEAIKQFKNKTNYI